MYNNNPVFKGGYGANDTIVNNVHDCKAPEIYTYHLILQNALSGCFRIDFPFDIELERMSFQLTAVGMSINKDGFVGNRANRFASVESYETTQPNQLQINIIISEILQEQSDTVMVHLLIINSFKEIPIIHAYINKEI